MKAKVLIIEDNDANRYLARFILEKHGYDVVTAINGIDGMARAVEERPDVIVMDLEMPEMDGYEAAERIHATPGLQHVPIMAFTSWVQPRDREKVLSSGFADYLEKPFDVDEFVDRVARLLRKPPS